jgi:hypothetical protein
VTTDERIDRLTGIVESLVGTVGSLAGTVGSLAGTVAAHDRQIGVLLQLAEEDRQRMANLEKQWQAYLTRIAPV